MLRTALFSISSIVVITCVIVVAFAIQLPNTSGMDGQLTANLEVDHFFAFWLVFNNEDVQMSDEPFTILAPRNGPVINLEQQLQQQPELLKTVLLDHIVLGTQLDITNTTTFKTLSGKQVVVHRKPDGNLYANEAQILQPKIPLVPNGTLIIIDRYLFPIDGTTNETTTTVTPFTKNHEYFNITTSTTPLSIVTSRSNNATFVDYVSQVLSYLKNGVRVFQHFLSRSNVTQLLKEGEEYTVFVPTDYAFQRWHPIDWGFYPFSVPEFTESVMINHFVRGNLRQDSIRDGQTTQTLGGKELVFHKTSSLTVNNAPIVKGDTTVTNGNIMFIGEVLFVSESIVSRLHQQNRDKETPPLLAFPWFGAQFLSHAFLALERDKRFTHITRFLNLADLAPHVSGTGYTFFVPTDEAFEQIGLDQMPDNYLSTGDGLQILLDHFVKGRLYDRDLKNGTHFQTLGNKTITITRTANNSIIINGNANIVETEVFVYNLGTMFYIDHVLFVTKTFPIPIPNPTTTSVELIEDNNNNSNMPEVLFADAEAPTTTNTTTIK